ncbi:MAG: endonuclease/exonuclease/phosphatase family protein [Gemmatimonadales bacterium]
MSPSRALSVAVVALVLLVSPISSAAAQPRNERPVLPIAMEVMTFNIRTSAIPDGDDAWPLRKERVIETIARLDPDVLGLQEALTEQIEFIARELPQYRWLGVDRGLNGGTGLSEATPIFYKHAELVPLESGTFWLGDMPNGSYRGRDGGRGGSRIVTWARFHHLETGRDLWVYNTHLSPRPGQQHIVAAERINERIAALPEGSAVIVLGDFNATAGESDTWRAATGGGLRDAWDAAAVREGPAATYNGFRPVGDDEEGEGRIDWVLIGGPVDVSSAATIIDSMHGHYPSDHFPVVAKLTIRPS